MAIPPPLLADENVPKEAVLALRHLGCDLAWVQEIAPGLKNGDVVDLARKQGRVLLTFDKDFGELVFREGYTGLRGVILIRIGPHSPEAVSDFLSQTLQQEIPWEGHYSVVLEGTVRSVPLPKGQP